MCNLMKSSVIEVLMQKSLQIINGSLMRFSRSDTCTKYFPTQSSFGWSETAEQPLIPSSKEKFPYRGSTSTVTGICDCLHVVLKRKIISASCFSFNQVSRDCYRLCFKICVFYSFV